MNKLKNKFKKMPIGNKITLMYAGLFSVVLICISVFIIINTAVYYNNLSEDEVNATISRVAEHIKSGGSIDREALDELATNKNIQIRVTKLNMPHSIMPDMHYRQPRMRGDINIEDVEFPPIDEIPPERRQISRNVIKDEPFFLSQDMVEYNGERYLIQALRPYKSEQNTIRVFTIIFIVVNLLSIFVAYLIGRVISEKLLKPVREVTEAAGNISISSLDQRIAVPEAKDEVQRLAITFNEMIERLESSVNQQKLFVSDASHELRTPISVIQGYANLLSRWGKDDKETLEEAIASIKDETEYMSSLVKKLLFLAKGEGGEKVNLNQAINLNEMANEIIREVNLLEDDVRLELIADDEQNEIWGDYNLIKQLMWIFIENSMKYRNIKCCEIKIIIEKILDCKCLKISFADNGIGISDEDLPHVFDRFFRGDKSRNKEIPGNGLGLSIANWIIKSHNGNIGVKSKLNEGTTFEITFPVANKDFESGETNNETC